jgi:hypothetical protein
MSLKQLKYLNQVGRRSLINMIWMKTYGSSLYTEFGKDGSCVLQRCFYSELSATQRPESLRNFFKKCFNKRTTLPVFISLFEHVMAGWAEKEALEDLATSFTMPILKIPSNMLKQVSEIYTMTVFNMYEEFIESLGYYVSSLNNDG